MPRLCVLVPGILDYSSRELVGESIGDKLWGATNAAWNEESQQNGKSKNRPIDLCEGVDTDHGICSQSLMGGRRHG